MRSHWKVLGLLLVLFTPYAPGESPGSPIRIAPQQNDVELVSDYFKEAESFERLLGLLIQQQNEHFELDRLEPPKPHQLKDGKAIWKIFYLKPSVAGEEILYRKLEVQCKATLSKQELNADQILRVTESDLSTEEGVRLRVIYWINTSMSIAMRFSPGTNLEDRKASIEALNKELTATLDPHLNNIVQIRSSGKIPFTAKDYAKLIQLEGFEFFSLPQAVKPLGT